MRLTAGKVGDLLGNRHHAGLTGALFRRPPGAR
jgi:hypothetical protein